MNMISKQELLEKVTGGTWEELTKCLDDARAKYLKCFRTAQETLTGPELVAAVHQCEADRENDFRVCDQIEY